MGLGRAEVEHSTVLSHQEVTTAARARRDTDYIVNVKALCYEGTVFFGAAKIVHLSVTAGHPIPRPARPRGDTDNVVDVQPIS